MNQLFGDSGVITVVSETPCFACHRLARYTVFHRANTFLLERLVAPITHSEIHEVVWELEHLQTQVAVGLCQCGADRQETTSAEFAATATREDLGFVAPDLSFEICSFSVDGRLLWERNGAHQVLDVPDPTPDEAIEASHQRMRLLYEASKLSSAGLLKLEQIEAKAVGYIQAKARLFCRIGADAYRRQDALGEPDSRPRDQQSCRPPREGLSPPRFLAP